MNFKEFASAGALQSGLARSGFGARPRERARTSPRYVGLGRNYVHSSTIHTGRPSRAPASGRIDKDVRAEAYTDLVRHLNGGHTRLPDLSDPLHL